MAKKKTTKRAAAPASPRAALLGTLETMPDEAFGWLVMRIQQGIWPDGLGGFRPESRTAIETARKQALALMESQS